MFYFPSLLAYFVLFFFTAPRHTFLFRSGCRMLFTTASVIVSQEISSQCFDILIFTRLTLLIWGTAGSKQVWCIIQLSGNVCNETIVAILMLLMMYMYVSSGV